MDRYDPFAPGFSFMRCLYLKFNNKIGGALDGTE